MSQIYIPSFPRALNPLCISEEAWTIKRLQGHLDQGSTAILSMHIEAKAR